MLPCSFLIDEWFLPFLRPGGENCMIGLFIARTARPVFGRIRAAIINPHGKDSKMDQFYTPGRLIRLGIIGLGSRGIPQMKVLLPMEDVRIIALCDAYEDRLAHAKDLLKGSPHEQAVSYTLAEDMLLTEEMDAVLIMTSWETHIPLAIQAMQHGIVPGLEVGGASAVRACWQLVETSEQTGIPVMLLENCCYGEEEMALLQMKRTGLFGELVHLRGAYEHDLREEIGRGDITRHYRQRHFLHRNGDLYPTHALGPIMKLLGINRGNRMVSLVSVASKAAGLHEWLTEHRRDTPGLQNMPVACGDVVNTIITTAKGQTILLTHDCTLPRPYSRGLRVQGTRGIWMEDNRSMYVDGKTPHVPGHWTHSWESDAPYMKEYAHPLWTAYHEFGKRGGHGGMDFLVLRAFIEALQQGSPMPIDVYDTAALMAITALSEESIAQGSAPIAIPDFTLGRWLQPREKAEGKYALDD